MWQRFTERARRVVFFAQEEAGRLGENYVSTEHLLLGLVRENDSVAARILNTMGVPVARIRAEIERQVPHGDGRLGQDMQLTPRAKRVVDLSYDEARTLNNNYIGTEHLLLGLLREGEGLVGRVLNKLGVDLERTRKEIIALQDAQPKDPDAPPAEPTDRSELMNRVRSVIGSLMDRNPQLAKMPPDALMRALTGREDIRADAEGSDAPGTAAEPKIGDLGRLRNGDGRAQVEVAVDAEAFLHLVPVFLARDAFGYRALAESQRFFLVESGVTLKLLKPPANLPDAPAAIAEGGYYVRILDGEHAGRAGWIAANEFARTGPDESSFPPPVAEGEQ